MKHALGPFACLVVLSAGMASSARAQGVGTIYVPADDSAMVEEEDFLSVKGLNLLSRGGEVARSVRGAIVNGAALPGVVVRPERRHDEHGREDDENVQANDPTLDTILSFAGTRPFEESTQSETSVVTRGRHVVVGYNSSANQPVVQIGSSLFFTQRMLSGFSTSHDGGLTFKSGFVPATPGSVFTFGDPSLARDRKGNIYYASLAADAAGNGIIQVNKSTDNGDTWSTGVVVVTDNGSDKEWLAIGPDPAQPKRDNLYITWTSFQATGAQLWLAKSIDGGATWTTQLLFAPTNSGAFSSSLQFSNPVVDPSNGRLYVPFLHFTQALDADGVRVLASDDGGASFHFLAFNSPDAPDAFSYMVVTPGEFIDCGRNNGGFRPVLHQGSDDGGGRFGLARYVHATRLVTQPSAAAFRGRLFIAVQASTSPIFGDPTGGSEIRLLYSPDGGGHWATPLTVAASTAKEPQHVHPSIAVDQNGNRVFVGYYVQQADTKLRTDLVTVRVDGPKLRPGQAHALSTADFDLTPSNNPFPLATNPSFTTNYDRTITACYDIGEYMSVASSNRDDCSVVAAWGDNRRLWTSPADSPAAGEHAQADVFVTPKQE